MARKKNHGMSRTKEYKCWGALKNRCLNTKNIQYKDYGGRGITVCERWLKFENFFEDMGICPNGYQIDRIDNDKGYFKENCRWTSRTINSRNRRSATIHKIDNERLVQQELIDQIGWTKNQFRWFRKRHGVAWILENFKNGTLPERTNETIDRQDIVGTRFGKWDVLEFVSYIKKDGHLYKCRCECGIEKLIPRNNLMKNKTTQCRSCSAKESWEKRKS